MKDKKKIAGSIIKTQTKVLAYVVVCLVILIMGSSYALFFQVKHNTNNQVIQAGSLSITYTQGTKIDATTNPDCFEPMTDDDAKAKTSCTYTFSVKNAGTLPSTFTLNLKKGNDNTANLSGFNVIVKKKTTGTTFSDISGFPKTLNNVDTNNLLTESIEVGATVNYSVQVYPVDGKINEDTEDGKIISLNIDGYGEVDVKNANLK